MCLVINEAETEKFKAEAPEEITVYKIVKKWCENLVSPFRHTIITIGDFVAVGDIGIFDNCGEKSIDSGVIHCLPTYDDAVNLMRQLNVVHKDVNQMKHAFSMEWFLKLCKLITEKNNVN